MDLYRLKGNDPSEFEALNLDHVFNSCKFKLLDFFYIFCFFSDLNILVGIALIEWPDRLTLVLKNLIDKNENPILHLTLSIQQQETDKDTDCSNDCDSNIPRVVTLSPLSKAWRERLQRLTAEDGDLFQFLL